MHTTTLFFPCTAVTAREAITRRQSQSFWNVCAKHKSRDVNYYGLKQVLKLTEIASENIEMKCAGRDVRLCAVRVFQPSHSIGHLWRLAKDTQKMMAKSCRSHNELVYHPSQCGDDESGFAVDTSSLKLPSDALSVLLALSQFPRTSGFLDVVSLGKLANAHV